MMYYFPRVQRDPNKAEHETAKVQQTGRVKIGCTEKQQWTKMSEDEEEEEADPAFEPELECCVYLSVGAASTSLRGHIPFY